ncbi:MAG: hypothetical protein AMJ81_00675 [Phycisphaerae bacterium SM23_33]|jgi:hypothetical protein|nr:MAG: hypothetical protein AMJ81_00675 [Phycisphaerae bacterium SM23_33]
MRAAAALALSLALLGVSGEAPKAQEAAAASNVLTAWLDRADIHPAVRLGRLTIFPVTLKSTHRLRNLLTMQQAMQEKLLVIEELESPQVSRARFINKSGKHLIFLMAGEVVTGGKQSRTLATDALLGPDSATVLPLYCVEKGRWKGSAAFAQISTVAPQAVRERAAQGSGQGEIWQEVARANRRLRSSTPSEDLAAAMTTPENLKKLAELRERIRPKLPRGCAGVVVVREGDIVGADLFNSPELFAAMRAKVIDSYLSQYTHEASAGEADVARPDQHEVRRYLQACYRARFIRAEMRGVGQVYDIRGARFGQTLAHRPGYRIAPAERRIDRAAREAEYMVHTALMQEVVPVRPTPIRVPPPRPMPRRER